MVKRIWKKALMLLVFLGGIACMIASFQNEDYIVGCLSCLTVIIPVIIWFSDDKENQKRDERIDNEVNWYHGD